MTTSEHYDSSYFDYQQDMGRFGGWAELTKFAPHIRADDAVLDFGCGGGYLLAQMRNAIRAGLEINPDARKVAADHGLTVYAQADEVPDETFDIVISNHALEHCARPLDELLALRPKLKRGGRLVFFVPCETTRVGYQPDNPDHHLYTWSPMNFGNLFTEAGYEVLSAGPFNHRWPPHYQKIARLFGRPGFDFCCRVYGLWMRNVASQTYCYARKN